MKKFLFLGITEYLKILLGAAIALLNLLYSSEEWYVSILFYFIIFGIFLDVIVSAYKNYDDWESEKSLLKKKKIEAKDREEARLDRLDSKKFREEYVKKKESSEILLNKLIQESLIEEKEILSVAKTCRYYQLVVYSYSYSKILTSNERNFLTKSQKKSFGTLKRIYPEFLGELGFVRIGTSSGTTFVVNKSYLNKKFQEISVLKKHLVVELERVREDEWNKFLMCLKSFKGANRSLYEKYKSLFDEDCLPINFLITESLMNAGHLGFVRDQRIGIAPSENNNEFLVQLLAGTRIKDIKIPKDEKIRIKDFFKKTDMTFLLDKIDTKTRKKIEKNEKKIKKKFNIEYILDFSSVNEGDLQSFFDELKIENSKLAKTIIGRAIQFKEALDNLHVQLP